MKTNPNIGFACSEKFAELCALATTGALTLEECARIEKHIAGCQKCRDLLAEYESLASDGMAKIGAEANLRAPHREIEDSWSPAEAKSRLLDILRAGETERVQEIPPAVRRQRGTQPGLMPALRRSAIPGLGAAAVLIFGLLAGYQFALKKNFSVRQTSQENFSSAVAEQLRSAQAERETLNADLATGSKRIAELSDRANRTEKQLAELKVQKAALEARAQELGSTNQEQSESLHTLSAERQALERKLEEAEQSLKSVKEDLNAVQQERRKALLRTASLETSANELSSKLRERDETVRRDEQFLASDRDVRELMGARQLYIADVFDIDQSGEKRKPFGRVFYTKGKSLIFYAFDLDQQPAYRDAKARDSKAFQVWGSAEHDNAKPVRLGLFYMDSEANRRWVFKSDDPNVLAQVNAVFVTVESKDGTKTPSGKPFLYAYLRAAPANHP